MFSSKTAILVKRILPLGAKWLANCFSFLRAFILLLSFLVSCEIFNPDAASKEARTLIKQEQASLPSWIKERTTWVANEHPVKAEVAI